MSWRRPTPGRCEETAVWLLRIATGETGRLDALLDADTCSALIHAAGIVDGYGLAIAAGHASRPELPLPGQLALDAATDPP